MRIGIASLALLWIGCEGAVDPAEIACGDPEAVVSFETRDGLRLEADYRPAWNAGTGAVVLLHMNPVNFDRSGWPERVREALGGSGLHVLNVDRRGAGGSEGRAEEATEGPGALWDVEAAVQFLVDPARACPAEAGKIVLAGASNGTTGTFDYLAEHRPELPDPAGLAWMSPGTYTEQQNRINDQRERLDPQPMLWLYPTDEPYSGQWIAGAPEGWSFYEDGDQHGTHMFDGGELESRTVERLEDFVREVAR